MDETNVVDSLEFTPGIKYSYARICCENFYARKLYIFGRWEKKIPRY
jgi:hypothetical protein